VWLPVFVLPLFAALQICDALSFCYSVVVVARWLNSPGDWKILVVLNSLNLLCIMLFLIQIHAHCCVMRERAIAEVALKRLVVCVRGTHIDGGGTWCLWPVYPSEGDV
jgi:hypothetical protein